MNLLTFDIEDWFHTHENRHHFRGPIWKTLPAKIEENTDRILALLERQNRKATFFVLGWVADHYPGLIKKIQSKGHEIGAHSYWHHNPHLLTPEDFEKDTKRCLSVLEDITGNKITAYRAPGFNLNLKDQWAFDILAFYGIRIDSSVQLRRMPGTVPFTIKTSSENILEFPLITSRWGVPFTGGGYFRAMPKAVFHYLFQQQNDHLLYFHPRDFDAENPVSNLFSFSRNRLNRLNTGKCMNRLEEILQQHATVTLYEAAKPFFKNPGTT